MTKRQTVLKALGYPEYLYFETADSTFFHRLDPETGRVYWLNFKGTWNWLDPATNLAKIGIRTAEDVYGR